MIADRIDQWSGGQHSCCRVLIGMQSAPRDELRAALSLVPNLGMDQSRIVRLKQQMAEEFRQQLMVGAPNNADEAGLRQLSRQLKEGKVVIKLFLRHNLHAKLYLFQVSDPLNPFIGYVGSSNLTFAGLVTQTELNLDVLETNTCEKLQGWFDELWDDRWCLDISAELAAIIDESWARGSTVAPYHVYLKMIYHLSQEARAGLAEFSIPFDMNQELFDFQAAAVKIAARHLKQRGGVLIGDVVGLGKTMMATALARMMEDSYGYSTLIICPKHLEDMWVAYSQRYGLRARVLPLSRVTEAEMQTIPARYRLVLIDESHNLRNPEGQRYKALKTYIQQSDSKCILLSATPYNKQYRDLSAQLGLFLDEDEDLGIRPEMLLREIGELDFARLHQRSPSTLAAFEKSTYADDWRELMRRYLVRRTRSFIKQNYAVLDVETGLRFLQFSNGNKTIFPQRIPRTLRFNIDPDDPNNGYSRLLDPLVVDAIDELTLPRYALGMYLRSSFSEHPSASELAIIEDLRRARNRLRGFSRTNIFKRLESGGPAFLQSIERHILRNYIVLHALDQNRAIPLGSQSAALLDSSQHDQDHDITTPNDDPVLLLEEPDHLWSPLRFRQRASVLYQAYATRYHNQFKWVRPSFFSRDLKRQLMADIQRLHYVATHCGQWIPAHDRKLQQLVDLIERQHPHEKILVFTQFADTLDYLKAQLHLAGIQQVATIKGGSVDATMLIRRFSPKSNGISLLQPSDEIRILIATDVLSEGQNLQDAHIIVNYDLPWAIIRLIQRAGRIDRIGQTAQEILCYSFLPADGIERILKLRARVRDRLRQNAEVMGSDEAFFEDEQNDTSLLDLYSENAAVLDGDDDPGEIDLVSYAYQIWKNAIDNDPGLNHLIPNLPDVIYSSRSFNSLPAYPSGVLVYLRTANGNDALAWVDEAKRYITQSQLTILQAAACSPNTPAISRHIQHHSLVQAGVEHITYEEQTVGGGLGRTTGARFRTYERLKHYTDSIRGQIFESTELSRAVDDIYRYPLRQTALDSINRQLRAGISDQALAELIMALRNENRLCIIHDDDDVREPRLICSLGIWDR